MGWVRTVDLGPPGLSADVWTPRQPVGVVALAASGVNRRHQGLPQQVAQVLVGHGLATVRFRLPSGDNTPGSIRAADMPRLVAGLLSALDWVKTDRALHGLPVGVFGTRTSAAAALVVAASFPARVAAVVSCGGQIGLASSEWPQVSAATLLIVNALDWRLLADNRAALHALSGVRRLEVVPGSVRTFLEPGALATVAELSAAWFSSHLTAAAAG